jgi:3-oxoacyl-[acyl-carrier-protein] synthase II
MADSAPGEIDLIQAAANGGRDPDAAEAAAYKHLFGGSDNLLITSIKGATGENFASGGIRAGALALSLRQGLIPSVVGLNEPLMQLPFVIGASMNRPVGRGLLSGISWGGTYACLVFERGNGNEQSS